MKPYSPNPDRDFAILIGEAITDDVEAWEPIAPSEEHPDWRLRVTRDGRDYMLTIQWQS